MKSWNHNCSTKIRTKGILKPKHFNMIWQYWINHFSEIPQSGDTGILSQQLSSLSPKWRNWWIRIATSWLMLFGFIFVGYCGPIAIVLLVLAIQIKCFHEVYVYFKRIFSSRTSHYFEIRIMVLGLAVKIIFQIITIGYMVYRNYELPWFRTISWYFLFCANYFFYGETINEYFGSVLEERFSFYICQCIKRLEWRFLTICRCA